MEWIYLLIGIVVGFSLKVLMNYLWSKEKIRFKTELLIWKAKFFLKHKMIRTK